MQNRDAAVAVSCDKIYWVCEEVGEEVGYRDATAS